MAARIHRLGKLSGLLRPSSPVISYYVPFNRRYCKGLNGSTVRIGCSSGFWGDTAVSAPQLIYGGKIDYLVSDYLSEITMSLMTAAKTKNPEMGYAPDFVLASTAPYVKEIKKRGIRVISNAGGTNPEACAVALRDICQKASVDLNIAVVTGDNLMPKCSEINEQGYKEMFSGCKFPSTVNSMNAYLGAGPIARALDLGADIVITGRCTDSALVLAPLLHKFQWKMDEFDKLAAGSLAGHLIECGAQVTGGIFTDWHKVENWDNIGFPIVECDADGGIIVTKPAGTGGLVSTATVSEQLLYEIADPAHYFLPDVVCDFTGVNLTDLGENKVLVEGAKGRPPTSDYKVCATYLDGYRCTAVAGVGGPNSKAKAEKTAEAIIKRCKKIFAQMKLDDFTNVEMEVLGSEQMYGPNSRIPQGSRESVMWLAVHHQQKKALQMFAREIAPAGTGMAPGLTGIVGGRPSVSPVLKLFSYLYPKDQLKLDIHMNGEYAETFQPQSITTATYNTGSAEPETAESSPLPGGNCTYRLSDLAYTRSGDKGNSANVGVVARHPSILPYLQQAVTAKVVDEYFGHLFMDRDGPLSSRVQRYDVPGIHGMNFVLHNVLGGGGIASLRCDPQGKAMGQMLLDLEIKNMPDFSSVCSTN
ncbi:uncharacterized protein LOC132553104 [Ylistrum balloti]|uniref:uncharacterized protein LOC132553104 n=1 Tax=Ylistrum balloti TaxID=509963 RepID=UPI002905F79F|nr:uncharacterized protein LOC132553104 [Ylistrum balloti]